MKTLDLHPTRGGARLTLRGVFRSAEDAAARVAALEAKGLIVHSFQLPAPSGTALHHVAARHAVQPAARAGLPHVHTADWEATRMAAAAFRHVLRAARGIGIATRWYKALDVESLHACIRRYRWHGSRLEVAAHILSSTVVAHPFPNANHRTSLYLARLYLESAGVEWPHYSLRGRGAARFHRDTQGFILDSKYLLQLLRHRDMVRVAWEEGYTRLGIGPSAEVPIRPVDLELTPAEVRERHQGRAQRLIEDLADARSRAPLAEPNTRRLRDWVAWYQA